MRTVRLTDWEYDNLRVLTKRKISEIFDNLYRYELEQERSYSEKGAYEIERLRTELQKYSGLVVKLGEPER